ncbi:MAG: 50S ribosomal protein L5 [Candidatus Pacebacteria bacterium]|nr:50S ribosomal protein L5 [Candidatus Paceibacterota bacterium]
MESVKEKQKKAYEAMKAEFGYANSMAAPRITKVTINIGTGKRSRNDRNFNELVTDRIAKITGQKPAIRGAKKSIAGFKIRTNDPVGQLVTLRVLACSHSWTNSLISRFHEPKTSVVSSDHQ